MFGTGLYEPRLPFCAGSRTSSDEMFHWLDNYFDAVPDTRKLAIVMSMEFVSVEALECSVVESFACIWCSAGLCLLVLVVRYGVFQAPRSTTHTHTHIHTHTPIFVSMTSLTAMCLLGTTRASTGRRARKWRPRPGCGSLPGLASSSARSSF
jgi:hypothetical protein